jgi:hypothetical protein
MKNLKLVQLFCLLIAISINYSQAQTRTEKDLLGEKQIPNDIMVFRLPAQSRTDKRVKTNLSDGLNISLDAAPQR